MTFPNPEASQQQEESSSPSRPPGRISAAMGDNQDEEESPLYCISFERIAELKRSAVILLAERRGPDAPSRLKADHELDNPQELLDEIADSSGAEENFIHSNMPVQEIVFRMLLTRRNQPTALSELHRELTERWSTPVRPINVTLKNLERILDSDTYYGFARQNS